MAGRTFPSTFLRLQEEIVNDALVNPVVTLIAGDPDRANSCWETKHHEHILNIAKVAFTEAALIEHTCAPSSKSKAVATRCSTGPTALLKIRRKVGVGDFSAPFPAAAFKKEIRHGHGDMNMKGRIPLAL